MVPLKTSMSPIGRIDAMSREALHNNAFTGRPEKFLFDVPAKSLNVIPGSLLPVMNEPPGSFFVVEVLVSDCIDEHAVKAENKKKNIYLNIYKPVLFKNNMQQKKGPDNWPLR